MVPVILILMFCTVYFLKGSFNNCTSLVKISIPPHIERIEALSFASCPYLLSVQLAEGLKYIDYRAFYGCGMAEITIPSTVTFIAKGAFSNCRNLKCSGITLSKSLNDLDRQHVLIDEEFLGVDEESRDCQKSLQQSLMIGSIPTDHRRLLAQNPGLVIQIVCVCIIWYFCMHVRHHNKEYIPRMSPEVSIQYIYTQI